MQCIPDKVESRNFVGNELHSEQHGANPDHPPILKHVQTSRQRKDLVSPEQSQGGNRGVNVQSGSETRAYQQPEDLIAPNWNIHAYLQ
jgi:hypothetical protein